MLQRAIDCLRFNRASTKANSEVYYSTSLPFSQVTVCRALFVFSDVLFPQWNFSIFHFMMTPRCLPDGISNPTKATICDIQPGIERLAFSIAIFDFFVCTEATLLFMMRNIKRWCTFKVYPIEYLAHDIDESNTRDELCQI